MTPTRHLHLHRCPPPRQTAYGPPSSRLARRANGVRLHARLLLLLLALPLHLQAAVASVAEPSTTTTCVLSVPEPGAVTSDGLVDVLWDWCRTDGTCRKAYHQSADAPNRTVFRHLLPPEIILAVGTPGADVYAGMRDALCHDDVEQSNRALWLQRLVAHRRTLAPLCDVNHELRFDAMTLRSECVCQADRVCTDAIYDLAPFYAALALVMVAAIAFMGGSVYKNVRLVRKLTEATGDASADTSALLSALT